MSLTEIARQTLAIVESGSYRAPSGGVVQLRDAGAIGAVRETLASRAGKVLAVLAAHGHGCIVLGAWGCGVFCNDPAHVADAFAAWLESDSFRGAFDRVVFAVYDRSPAQRNRRAFEERFAHCAAE
jgi:uncharacterized protein (TIGR02452 family)